MVPRFCGKRRIERFDDEHKSEHGKKPVHIQLGPLKNKVQSR